MSPYSLLLDRGIAGGDDASVGGDLLSAMDRRGIGLGLRPVCIVRVTARVRVRVETCVHL